MELLNERCSVDDGAVRLQHCLSCYLVILVDTWPGLNSPKGSRTSVPEN